MPMTLADIQRITILVRCWARVLKSGIRMLDIWRYFAEDGTLKDEGEFVDGKEKWSLDELLSLRQNILEGKL